MESLPYSLSTQDYLLLFFLRPFSAFLFILFILFLGWWLAWNTVLVHVPLVQEIFGLRKKSVKGFGPSAPVAKESFSPCSPLLLLLLYLSVAIVFLLEDFGLLLSLILIF
ncbi:unnamed protein product [Amaranthus hypochondriacus]